MYNPSLFSESRIEVLHGVMTSHPFATLVTFGEEGLCANHLPMVLHTDLGEFGTLRGHVARPNPIWKNHEASSEVMAIFQGADSYITPSWYPSKFDHGKVVPTWNYTVVHVRGALRFIKDTAWLRTHIEELTTSQEANRPLPWSVSDAPDDYIERMMRGIIGLELVIDRIEGKMKVSQNKEAGEIRGVSHGLRAESDDKYSPMADLVEQYGDKN